MKKKTQVLVFITAVLAFLTLAPITNVAIRTADKIAEKTNTQTKPWWHYTMLYNLDFATSLISRCLYPLGISVAPDQVIIGKDNWLFLGDRYVNTRSVVRNGQTEKDRTAAVNIGEATTAWATWFKENDVQLYRVVVAPNKSSIYPEYLPTWAQPVTIISSTDALFSRIPEHYIDLRNSLIMRKNSTDQNLFFRTDTHWNSYGAWTGFQYFIDSMNKTGHELNIPETTEFKFQQHVAGDLANFLRISEILSDTWATILTIGSKNIKIQLYDYNTHTLIRTQDNWEIHPGLIQKPLRVISQEALNSKKVLWVRDSFGTAFAPFMAATFTDILQIHYHSALVSNGLLLKQLVKSYKPDYVFLMVVERDALSLLFQNLPNKTL